MTGRFDVAAIYLGDNLFGRTSEVSQTEASNLCVETPISSADQGDGWRVVLADNDLLQPGGVVVPYFADPQFGWGSDQYWGCVLER